MRTWLRNAIALFAIASAALAAEPKTVVLEVAGMTCSLCPMTVRKALERVPGVLDARVDFAATRAQVEFDPQRTTPDALAKAVTDAGFPATLKQP